jgi:hypothetical protein
VKPFPILQVVNLALGLLIIALELPLKVLAGTALQQSIKARLFALPLPALAASFLYQATNPVIYYMISMGVYLWANVNDEVRIFEDEREKLSNECTCQKISYSHIAN